MIFSQQYKMSDAQAVTATAISTNVIDLGAMGQVEGAAAALARDIGPGTEIPILVQVVEDFATLTSLTITIESSDSANLSSSQVAYSSGAIPAADLVAGYQVSVQRLPNKITGRYLGIRYTVGGSNATAGKVTAGLVAGVQTNA